MHASPSDPASDLSAASDLPHGLLLPGSDRLRGSGGTADHQPLEPHARARGQTGATSSSQEREQEAPTSESLDDPAAVGDAVGTIPGGSESDQDTRGELDDGPEHAAPPEGVDEAPIGEPPSADLELAVSAQDGDDDVHFAVAAKALGVSRKTVERMVKRDQLLRGPSGASATVSKRSLVAKLEDRRGSGVSPSHAAPVEQARSPSEIEPSEVRPVDVLGGSQEIVRSALEPWIEEIVSSRTQSALLQKEVDRLTDRSARERARDELLFELTTGSWLARRRARKDALRRVILGRNEPEIRP